MIRFLLNLIVRLFFRPNWRLPEFIIRPHRLLHEAGLVMSASEGVQLGVSGFGEFSESADTYGGRAPVGIKF